MSLLQLLLVILLVLIIVGSVPAWPYSANWGYGPSGGLLAVALIVLLVLALTGRL